MYEHPRIPERHYVVKVFPIEGTLFVGCASAAAFSDQVAVVVITALLPGEALLRLNVRVGAKALVCAFMVSIYIAFVLCPAVIQPDAVFVGACRAFFHPRVAGIHVIRFRGAAANYKTDSKTKCFQYVIKECCFFHAYFWMITSTS